MGDTQGSNESDTNCERQQGSGGRRGRIGDWNQIGKRIGEEGTRSACEAIQLFVTSLITLPSSIGT